MHARDATTNRYDTTVEASFSYRLRSTSDVLGKDEAVLAEVLESSGEAAARVQFWLDAHVAASRPDLPERLRAFAARHPDRVHMVGEVEVVPGGEVVKNEIHILEYILKSLHAAQLDRRSYVVVIGGGAVLDAVGFAAAIAHRGLRLVRMPTTTLGQADSGVGVKNSVNLFGKKNWLGTFAVPWAVINDTAMLATLPARDFICGFSEVVKVSLLKDPAAFARLCRDASAVRDRDITVALPLIHASAQMHLKHITQGGDPFEMNQARPLDFGHWSAHKLEAMTGFRIRHGEAVALGVAIDSIYSSLALGLPRSDAERVLHCLADLGFRLAEPALTEVETLFEGLEEFRQHLGGELTLTMLRGVGDPIEVHEVDAGLMRQAISTVAGWGIIPNRGGLANIAAISTEPE